MGNDRIMKYPLVDVKKNQKKTKGDILILVVMATLKL